MEGGAKVREELGSMQGGGPDGVEGGAKVREELGRGGRRS